MGLGCVWICVNVWMRVSECVSLCVWINAKGGEKGRGNIHTTHTHTHREGRSVGARWLARVLGARQKARPSGQEGEREGGKGPERESEEERCGWLYEERERGRGGGRPYSPFPTHSSTLTLRWRTPSSQTSGPSDRIGLTEAGPTGWEEGRLGD